MKRSNATRIWTATAASAALAVLAAMLLAGCNGLLIVKDGPKAGSLNWAGKAIAWTGWDKAGLAEEVTVPNE